MRSKGQSPRLRGIQQPGPPVGHVEVDNSDHHRHVALPNDVAYMSTTAFQRYTPNLATKFQLIVIALQQSAKHTPASSGNVDKYDKQHKPTLTGNNNLRNQSSKRQPYERARAAMSH